MVLLLLQDGCSSQQSNSIKVWESALITYPVIHKMHPIQISQHYMMQHFVSGIFDMNKLNTDFEIQQLPVTDY